MSSYAKVTSSNAAPLSQQPKPDPSLLVTETTHGRVVDDARKINLAPSNFKSNPQTNTSEASVIPQYDNDDTGIPKKSRKQKVKDQLENAEAEGFYLWDRLHEQLLRPGVAGGLIGLANVGLLATAGYQFYTRPAIRSDFKIIGATVVGALALLGSEGIAAEAYVKTDAGQAEAKRAKEEGAAVYRHTKDIVLRPGVLGGLAGVVNVTILGTIGCYAYQNWDVPRWDRRTVAAVTAGLITLWAGEGLLVEQYKEKEYPKRR